MSIFNPIVAELRKIANELKNIRKVAEDLFELIKKETIPPIPGGITVTVTEEKENGMLIFKVTLQPPLVTDVVRRILTVKGAVTEITDITQLEFPGFEAADNESVEITLKDIDDQGNESPLRTVTQVITDDLPPPLPEAPLVTVTGET